MPRRRLACSFAALALSLSAASVCLAADVPISDKARAHFKAGVAYLNDPDGAKVEEAYNEFRAAYAESPSWKILGNLGITAYKLERDGEALEAWSKYLEEGGEQIEAAEKAQVTRDRDTLRAGVVTVELKVDPPGANLVDERILSSGGRVTNGYGVKPDGKFKFGVRAGRHQITAKLDGYKDATWTFDAGSGTTQKRVLKLEKIVAAPIGGPGGPDGPGDGPAKPVVTERPVPTSVWIGLAATGAFAIGAGVTGAMALGKRSDFDAANDGRNPAEAEDLKSSGQTLNLVTDVLLGGALISGGLTAFFFFTRPEVPVQNDRALRFQPLLGTQSAGFALQGRF